ncbi:TolC family protein [Alkalimonas amylolytica]|nr:TolC family protein [Alkalimonas amylolytica]
MSGWSAMLLMIVPIHLQAGPLSLAEAEQRLASNRTVLAQQADVDAWQAQQRALNSLNLPQLSITIAGIAYEKDVTFDIPVINQPAELDVFRSGIRSQLNLLWPLYTGGRTDAAQQQAAARVTEAEAEQRQLQLQLLKRLFDLYFSNQMMQQVVQVRQQALQTLDAHLHKAKRFEQEGLITQLNRMQAEVAQAEARREAVFAQRQLNDVRAALQNLLQLEELGCLSTPLPQPVPLTESADWFVNQAKRHNPVFQQLLAKDQQLKQQLRIEQGKRLPEVFLIGSYDLNRSATPLTEPDWSIGLGMRYHFTTSVDRRASASVVHSRQQQLDHSRHQADADIKLAVESSYRTVLLHLEQFELLQQDLQLAREHARLQQHAFEQGMATSLDVTDARLRQAAAEVQALQAACQYSSALAQLTQLSGQPELVTNWLPTLLQQQSCPAI